MLIINNNNNNFLSEGMAVNLMSMHTTVVSVVCFMVAKENGYIENINTDIKKHFKTGDYIIKAIKCSVILVVSKEIFKYRYHIFEDITPTFYKFYKNFVNKYYRGKYFNKYDKTGVN